LRVFEKSVLRKTFGRKREKVTQEWRLHNEELNPLALELNIYSLAHHLCKM